MRSFGFAAFDGDRPMGLAFASLVRSHSIEVSVFVDEPYRRRGVATAVSAALLIEGLDRGLQPNWTPPTRSRARSLRSWALRQRAPMRPATSSDRPQRRRCPAAVGR